MLIWGTRLRVNVGFLMRANAQHHGKDVWVVRGARFFHPPKLADGTTTPATARLWLAVAAHVK